MKIPPSSPVAAGTEQLVCLITPGHIASTPRLVKEAGALVEAGYRVHVLAGRHFPAADRFDAAILAAAPWSCTLVDWTSGPGVFARKVIRRLSRLLLARTPLAALHLAARAHHAESLRFAAVAAQVPARLFHGHCLAALPSAALAARRRGVLCGFDFEDYHGAETESAISNRADRIAGHVLQTSLVRECALLTAASPLIGAKIAELYGVTPLTLLNVFPRSEAPARPVEPAPISEHRPARCYWFSQTVGPGRGLEATVAILGAMRTPVELHLRGIVAPEYATSLQRLAQQAGLKRPIQFHPPAAASEMARLAATSDLGLSVEESQPLNRDVCLTNKIFTYLLAGIPQLLSRTTAQIAFAPELGESALLGALDQTASVAKMIDDFLADSQRVERARRTATDLARRRFCWDVEKTALVDRVNQLLRPAH